MNWSQYGTAVLAAFIGATLTDGFFSAILFSRNRSGQTWFWRASVLAHPWLWFMLTRLWALVTCAAFLFFCGFFGLTSMQPAIMFAVGNWLAIVLPMIASAHMLVQVDRWASLIHLLGWLAKLLVCSGAAFYFL